MDLDQIKQKLKELCNLPQNWDAQGSPPVRQDIADSILILVQQNIPYSGPSSIVPGFNGNCQLEYSTKGYYLELEIIEPYKAEIFIACDTKEQEPNDFYIHGEITWKK